MQVLVWKMIQRSRTIIYNCILLFCCVQAITNIGMATMADCGTSHTRDGRGKSWLELRFELRILKETISHEVSRNDSFDI